MNSFKKDYKKIFSTNLNYYMSINKKSQNDLIQALKQDKSTVSTWCNGTRLPRMDKIEILANYFNIQKSDLIENKEIHSKLNTSCNIAISIPLLRYIKNWI